ncbi:MAG: nuclear transport factor 2 family protein [Pyrinomonadaceae bacterium]|nr:nuclear transport factor 2 family protein [Pyrinomonadaceae bacterium]
MKIYFALAILMFGMTGCFSSENTATNEAPKPQAKQSPENDFVDEENVEPEEAQPEVKSEDAKASREEIESESAAEEGLGPTDTLRAFNDAVIKKDAAKIRSFLSRASIKMIEEDAKRQGKTVDSILTADDGAPMPVEREMKNEKIEGNNATVEVKNSVLGSFEPMFLVKEDGNWRIALDKIRDELMRRLNEMQKNAPPILKNNDGSATQ